MAWAKPSNGRHVLHLYTTGDIHGHYFDSLYSGGHVQNSLYCVSKFVQERRDKYGAKGVILLDAGDNLQGDNASYFYNYVSTDQPHVWPQMAAYMGYDAVTVGNHDIEAGAPVFERVRSELAPIPLLAANAFDLSSGKPHFQEYAILDKDGLKVAVIGFSNPNMNNWFTPEQRGGLDFKDPRGGFAQALVDSVRGKEQPDVVILTIHSGTGKGDGTVLENVGRDLLYELKGVDVIVCAHDHKPHVENNGDTYLVNSGSNCRYVGNVIINVEVKGHKVVKKYIHAGVSKLDRLSVDEDMARRFWPCFEQVRDFGIRPLGSLAMPLSDSPAYVGMSDLLGLIHRVSLDKSGADISFAAPHKFGMHLDEGDVVYNDLFAVYPYENDLFVLELTGAEVVRFLEASYDLWVVSGNPDHVLRIVNEPDERSGTKNWSFVSRSYNFDSAAGINYTVDVTKPFGQRVTVSSMADGSPFRADSVYRVAMTDYRATGGGGMLKRAGVRWQDRVVARMGDIRTYVYECFTARGTIGTDFTRCESVLGSWRFVPESAQSVLEHDLELVLSK